jgi:hypothetical protein
VVLLLKVWCLHQEDHSTLHIKFVYHSVAVILSAEYSPRLSYHVCLYGFLYVILYTYKNYDYRWSTFIYAKPSIGHFPCGTVTGM